jgi:hypothetical protein
LAIGLGHCHQQRESLSPAPSRRPFRFGDRSIEMKEAFHPCDLQSLVDSLIHAYQPQTASVFLSRDIGPDQRPNPRRIHQRYVREVENQGVRVVRTHLRLKAEYIEKRQWPRKTQNADSRPRPRKIFDVERLLWHARNVNSQ